MASIYDSIQETENCKNCEKFHKMQFDYSRHIIAEHHRYNTIVCSLGYGSLITILNFTKDNIYDFIKILVIVCLIISIGIFVNLEMGNLEILKAEIAKLTEAIHSNCELSAIKQIYNEFYTAYQIRMKSFNVLKDISRKTGFASAILLIIGILLPIIIHMLTNLYHYLQLFYLF